MSVKIISKVWDHAPYRGKKLLILLAMADFADDQGKCWPSQTTLARKARCSVETIRTTINEMIAAGHLEVAEEHTPNSSKRYMLTPNLLGADDVSPNPQGTPPKSSGDHPQIVGGRVPKSAWGEPSIEPSKEPSIEPIEGDSPSFDDFWNVFDLKNGKAGAKRAWDKAVKHTNPQVIIEGAIAYRQWLDNHPEPPSQKWAQGWLNDRRWEDELPEPQQRGGKQTYGQRKQAASVALLDAYRNDPRNQQPKGIEQ